MHAAEFENLALMIGIPALICFMFFIIYDLGKRSKAGKWGMFVLFFAWGWAFLALL